MAASTLYTVGLGLLAVSLGVQAQVIRARPTNMRCLTMSRHVFWITKTCHIVRGRFGAHLLFEATVARLHWLDESEVAAGFVLIGTQQTHQEHAAPTPISSHPYHRRPKLFVSSSI